MDTPKTSIDKILSTNLKTAMAETTIVSMAIHSNKCLETRITNETTLIDLQGRVDSEHTRARPDSDATG